MCRLRFTVSLLVAGFFASGFLLGEDKKPEAKEPIFIKRPQLPRYFGKLGLSAKQKKNIYNIRVSYAAKLAELSRQIKELKSKEKDELENVLTAGQKTQLRELTPVKPSKASENTVNEKTVKVKKK